MILKTLSEDTSEQPVTITANKDEPVNADSPKSATSGLQNAHSDDPNSGTDDQQNEVKITEKDEPNSVTRDDMPDWSGTSDQPEEVKHFDCLQSNNGDKVKQTVDSDTSDAAKLANSSMRDEQDEIKEAEKYEQVDVKPSTHTSEKHNEDGEPDGPNSDKDKDDEKDEPSPTEPSPKLVTSDCAAKSCTIESPDSPKPMDDICEKEATQADKVTPEAKKFDEQKGEITEVVSQTKMTTAGEESNMEAGSVFSSSDQ